VLFRSKITVLEGAPRFELGFWGVYDVTNPRFKHVVVKGSSYEAELERTPDGDFEFRLEKCPT